MSKNLSLDELKEKYKDLLNNRDLERISFWTEPNKARPTNEQAFKKKLLKNVDPFASKFLKAIQNNKNT